MRRGALELARAGTEVAAWAPEILSSLGLFAAQIFLTVITTYYLFKQGSAFVAFVRRVSPLRRAHTEAFLAEFGDVARGMLFGNVATALLHGLLAGIGYWIFGLPKVLFLGALTMLASFIPALGTSLVWGPICIVLALTGHPARAGLLLGYGAIIIGGIDNLMRPLLSKGRMKLPDLLLFLSIFGGILLWGPKGILLGPLIGSLAVTGLRLLDRDAG
jgi:predicted PurR-regulated permease PerM